MASVAAVLLSLRTRWSGRLLPALALPLAALAAIIATTIHGVEHARALLIGSTIADLDGATLARRLADGMIVQDDVTLLGATLFVWSTTWVAAAAAILAVRSARLRAHSPWPALLSIAGVTAVLVALGIVTNAWGTTIVDTFAKVGGLDPEAKSPAVAAGVALAATLARRGQWVITATALVAALLALVAAVRAARAGRVVGQPALALALFVALGGGWLRSVTRARAWDAAHPLPVIEASGLVSGRLVGRVPRVAACPQPLVQAPIIQSDERLAIEGHDVDNVTELRDLLITLRNNHRLLHPNEPWPDDAPVILLAPGDFYARLLAPVFDATRAAGYGSIDAAVIVPHDIDTRTLGRLARSSQCAHRFSLSTPFTPPPAASWAQVTGGR
jgi:hypothetical protein